MVIRIGVLGFAHGHVDVYCDSWRQRPELGARVVAGWDHDRARADKAAKKHGIELADSPEALVSRADVDAVVIGAETGLHADMVEAAAPTRKPIALQKPLAVTLDQADRILDAVERTGTPFTLLWQMRLDPQNVKMKELVESGVLGRICMARRRHGLATHTWPWFASSWHVDPKMNRDIWADDASHPVDLIYWLFGMPESVTCELATMLNPKVPNDNGIAILRYKGGLIAEVVCSFTCLAAENTTEIIGEKGSVIQNYGDVPSCGVPKPDNALGLKWYLGETKQWTVSEIASPKQHGERLANLAGPIVEFFRGARPPIATAREGRDVLRIILATYESVNQAKRITLDQ